MFDLDPTGWRWSTWWLYALAAWYVVNFFVFWTRFRVGERRARQGGPEDVRRYNLLLRGFPNAIFAKQFGKRPFELTAVADPKDLATR